MNSNFHHSHHISMRLVIHNMNLYHKKHIRHCSLQCYLRIHMCQIRYPISMLCLCISIQLGSIERFNQDRRLYSRLRKCSNRLSNCIMCYTMDRFTNPSYNSCTDSIQRLMRRWPRYYCRKHRCY